MIKEIQEISLMDEEQLDEFDDNLRYEGYCRAENLIDLWSDDIQNYNRDEDPIFISGNSLMKLLKEQIPVIEKAENGNPNEIYRIYDIERVEDKYVENIIKNASINLNLDLV